MMLEKMIDAVSGSVIDRKSWVVRSADISSFHLGHNFSLNFHLKVFGLVAGALMCDSMRTGRWSLLQ